METIQQPKTYQVSHTAGNLIGSEIIKLAGEINEKIKQGHKIYNLTIGDFNPEIYPVPSGFKQTVTEAYQKNQTNYPPADGMKTLRTAVAALMTAYGNFDYHPDDYLIAGGARPLIYGVYKTLVDPGDQVVFPVPSWNNNHYCFLHNAIPVSIETRPENLFLPTAKELEPLLGKSVLLALCSPLNPSGTCFKYEQLAEICEMVLFINRKRTQAEKPLYLMYDQIYSFLTYGETRHFHPVALFPELKPFTVYIDGFSKSFAATGVRIGWAMGPGHIINPMKAVLGHIGAWAPKAEQVALASYLQNKTEVNQFIHDFKAKLNQALNLLFNGLLSLQQEGLPVQVIAPNAAIYLTASFNLKGLKTPEGDVIRSTAQITAYLLNYAGMAIVPFSAFGADAESCWYRLSIGNFQPSEVPDLIISLRRALQQLT